MRPDELKKEVDKIGSYDKFAALVLSYMLTGQTIRGYVKKGIDPTRVDFIKRKIAEYKG